MEIIDNIQDLPNEIWKDVVGYEGLYMISNLGRIKSFHHKRARILKPGQNKLGYRMLSLFKNEIGKTKMVHRLIAESFIPNTENKPCIDHINGDPTDNRIENMKWCTHKENLNNPVTRKKMSNTWANEELKEKMRFMQKHRIGVDMLTLDGKYIRSFDSIRQASFHSGAWDSEIARCCKDESKSTGGYKWRFTTRS